VALCALVERNQQVQTAGVDEGQATQIEHQTPGTLDLLENGAERLDGGDVELAAGLHDRDVAVPLDLDGKRHEVSARPLGVSRTGERDRWGCRHIVARVSSKAHRNRFRLRRASVAALNVHDPTVRELHNHTKS
jgi:hypothetical protein